MLCSLARRKEPNTDWRAELPVWWVGVKRCRGVVPESGMIGVTTLPKGIPGGAAS